MGQAYLKYIYLRDQGATLKKINHRRDLKCTCLAQTQCPSIRAKGNFGCSLIGVSGYDLPMHTLLFLFFLFSFVLNMYVSDLHQMPPSILLIKGTIKHLKSFVFHL